MNNYKLIHESEFKMLIDMIDAFKDVGQSMKNGKNIEKNTNPLAHMSSIARAVSNMTLVFPVICTRGISIENASLISKAVEKNCVGMLQRLMSAHQIRNEEDLMSYVQLFHKNISTDLVDLDDIFNMVESMTELQPMTQKDINTIKEAMQSPEYYLPENVNEVALTDFVVKEGAATPNPSSNNKNNSIKDLKDSVDIFKNQIPDSDFKKANELMPTSLVVNFKSKDDQGTVVDYSSGVIGVKAKLYPISSNDIISHIAERNANNNWLTNFIRASTKEISFIKDFVLAIDKAKSDALSMSSRRPTADKLWKVLERRANVSKINRLMKNNDNSSAAAIATLCVSQEEVEYLRKQYSIDLERTGVVRGLFESLNLMSIVIVDEALEVAKFVFDDGSYMWETISFNHLEREASDSTYKRVINFMTKTR